MFKMPIMIQCFCHSVWLVIAVGSSVKSIQFLKEIQCFYLWFLISFFLEMSRYLYLSNYIHAILSTCILTVSLQWTRQQKRRDPACLLLLKSSIVFDSSYGKFNKTWGKQPDLHIINNELVQLKPFPVYK